MNQPSHAYNKLLNRLVILFIGVVTMVATILVYMEFWPVDVIKNSTWKLTVPNSSYTVGDTVTVHVVSDKLRNLGGRFTRTLECQSPTTPNAYTSYFIAESLSNRAPGHVETDIQLVLPLIVANLPAKCRIGFIIDYEVYSFRSFSEYNFTNLFELYPKHPSGDKTVSDPIADSTPVAMPSVQQRTPQLAQPQPTPPSEPKTNQKPGTPTPDPQSKPSILQQVLNGVTNTIKGIL